jgi:hypothetical protein
LLTPKEGRGHRRSRKKAALVAAALAAVFMAVGVMWVSVRGRQVRVPQRETAARPWKAPVPSEAIHQAAGAGPVELRPPEVSSRAITDEPRSLPAAQPPGVAIKHPVERRQARPPQPSQGDGRSASELLNRARAQWQEGNVDDAIALGRSAVGAGGGSEVHTFLGMALLRKGQPAAAEGELREALRLSPENRKAVELLERARRSGSSRP